MSSYFSQKAQIVILYCLLIGLVSIPIWGVKYFVTQDGPAHVYTAMLFSGLLAGNSSVNETYSLNSVLVPNSIGHWLLALLLLIAKPFTATKIIVTLTFAGFVASVGWLRWSVKGYDGIKTSLLIGGVFAFNWLWLLGLYNFIIGVIVFVFAVGVVYRWNGQMNWRRCAGLSGLFLIAYFSHLITFGLLVGTVGLFTMLQTGQNRFRSTGMVFAALLPAVPFVIAYKLLAETGGGFIPGWYVVNEGFSIASIATHIRVSDPFVIISRRFLPFSTSVSSLNSLAAPVLWILLTLTLLTVATLSGKVKGRKDGGIDVARFAPILVILILALAAPDEFGSAHGSMVRPRLLLCGLLLLVPLLNVSGWHIATKAAQVVLIIVFSYQWLALMEYAGKSDRETTEFLTAGAALKDGDTIASITILEDPVRFHSNPPTQSDNFFGMEKQVLVRDNYEMGYYLFPVVIKDRDEQAFIRDFTSVKVFKSDNSAEIAEWQMAGLRNTLEANNRKIGTMLVWGRDERVETLLQKWYEPQPYFENGNVRLFRNRVGLENNVIERDTH